MNDTNRRAIAPTTPDEMRRQMYNLLALYYMRESSTETQDNAHWGNLKKQVADKMATRGNPNNLDAAGILDGVLRDFRKTH